MSLKNNIVEENTAKPKTLGSLHIRMCNFEICTFDRKTLFFYNKYGIALPRKEQEYVREIRVAKPRKKNS